MGGQDAQYWRCSNPRELRTPASSSVRPGGRPESLVFNWKEEAHLHPQLRVLEHTGLERNGNDFALTTVSPLRHAARDASLQRRRVDYVVLDEAQVVKMRKRIVEGRRFCATTPPGGERHSGGKPLVSCGLYSSFSTLECSGCQCLPRSRRVDAQSGRRNAPPAGSGVAAVCLAPNQEQVGVNAVQNRANSVLRAQT